MLLGACLSLSAQGVNALEVNAHGPVSVQRGKAFQVPVKLNIRSGFHINTNDPGDKYLIPLQVSWESKLVEVGKTEFAEGKKMNFPFSEKPVAVYEGSTSLVQHFTVKPDAARGFSAVTGTLKYQACNDRECYPPATARIRVAIDVR
jgi:thiol:disulfide interchange protein DsbD